MAKSSSVSLQFLGAAGTVTGSKHLLRTPSINVMIDCGLFQGLKPLRLKNWDPFPVDAGTIDAVILTHAHLDHCGYLPLLGRSGFRGKIYCTGPTRDLAEIILRDSARIQEEDAANANRGGYTRHKPALPLYTERDVENILPAFSIVEAQEKIWLNEHVTFRMFPNGHILGSVFVEMNCYSKTIVFSGDVGRPVSTLLPEPIRPTAADFLVMESTYGDRLHTTENIADQLNEVILDTVRNKGTLLIPSFAVGRAQELMHLINQLKKENRIPNLPVFVDSPMASNATEVMERHRSWHHLNDEQCHALFNDVTAVRNFEETMRVADLPAPKIVIAASGMLTGGRVLYYLEKYLVGKRNAILFTGYQSEGTRGRAILRGAHEVKIHGAYVPVRMRVHALSAMSGHADQKEMIDWLSGLRLPSHGKVFLVHGENAAREAFRLKLESVFSWNVALPQHGDEITLFQV